MKKFICTFVFLFAIFNAQSETTRVGVLVPLEHKALDEIVAGVKETFKKSGQKIEISIQNAQGDINIQRGILKSFQSRGMDYVMPIGTAATQMALQVRPKAPIVALAAEVQDPTPKNVAGILDELPVKTQFTFLKRLFPKMKKFSLVYSASEKIFPEAEELFALAKKEGVVVQRLMINQLADIYTIGASVAPDSEFIFILKDHMVVSGIKFLSKVASKKKIPLITSDEGSVLEGGSLALGVKEKDIGVEGAQILLKVISGTPTQKIGIQTMSDLRVFINQKQCASQSCPKTKTFQAARDLGYAVNKI